MEDEKMHREKDKGPNPFRESIEEIISNNEGEDFFGDF